MKRRLWGIDIQWKISAINRSTVWDIVGLRLFNNIIIVQLKKCLYDKIFRQNSKNQKAVSCEKQEPQLRPLHLTMSTCMTYFDDKYPKFQTFDYQCIQHSVVKSNVNANKVLQSFIYAYCTITYTVRLNFSSPYASTNYKYICISAPVKCVTLFIASTTAVRDSGDLVCIKGPWHFSDLGQFCALPYCHIHTCSRLQVCVLGHAQSLSPFMVIWSCLPPRSHSPSPVQYRKYTHRLQWKPMRGCLR